MINLLTWNIKMLPGPLGNGSDDELRARKICDAILDVDPDIVCLQEVFDEGIRSIVNEHLSDAYGNIIEKSDVRLSLAQDSGLFFASKYPITSHMFRPYFNGVMSDALANKGALAVSIDTQDGPIAVITSHLQADYGDIGEYEDVRRYQISQIAKVSASFSEPTLIVGDLNISAEENEDPEIPTPEYLRFLRLLDARDLFREECHGCTGTTFDPDNPMVKDNEEAQRLDYILASGEAFTCNRSTIMRMDSLSDHYAVYAEVEV